MGLCSWRGGRPLKSGIKPTDQEEVESNADEHSKPAEKDRVEDGTNGKRPLEFAQVGWVSTGVIQEVPTIEQAEERGNDRNDWWGDEPTAQTGEPSRPGVSTAWKNDEQDPEEHVEHGDDEDTWNQIHGEATRDGAVPMENKVGKGSNGHQAEVKRDCGKSSQREEGL